VREAILTPQALVDIREIWQWISQDNVEAANRVESAIFEKIAKVARMPGVGHRRADVKNPSYLFVNVYSYSIGYEHDDVSVTVIRVLHGSRDFKNLFPNP
jgi:plasmid stabilization system protein ParE